MPGHPGPGRSEQPFLIAVIVIGTESPAAQNGGYARGLHHRAGHVT